jgi:hypothetical protein
MATRGRDDAFEELFDRSFARAVAVALDVISE